MAECEIQAYKSLLLTREYLGICSSVRIGLCSSQSCLMCHEDEVTFTFISAGRFPEHPVRNLPNTPLRTNSSGDSSPCKSFTGGEESDSDYDDGSVKPRGRVRSARSGWPQNY